MASPWTSTSGSQSSSNSSLNDTQARIGGSPIRVGDIDRDTSGDSCSFYALEHGQTCRKARTCYDCLNTPVHGEADGCVLMPQGFCQTINRYDYRSDYRRNVSARSTAAANSWYNFYPSINATYCEPTDAACARCRKIADIELSPLLDPALALNGTEEEARQFCTGAHGCVCVVACEYANWNATVVEECPNDPFAPQHAVATQVQTYRALFPIFMCLQMALLGTVVYRRRLFARRRERNRAVAEGPYNNVRAISSPSNRLRLSGWRAARETQMHREKNPRMYLHLDTPAHMQFTEELQQEVKSSGTDALDNETDVLSRHQQPLAAIAETAHTRGEGEDAGHESVRGGTAGRVAAGRAACP